MMERELFKKRCVCKKMEQPTNSNQSNLINAIIKMLLTWFEQHMLFVMFLIIGLVACLCETFHRLLGLPVLRLLLGSYL
jgi:hypothetical protein